MARSHGLPSTYSAGACRCTTADGLFRDPRTTGCTEAWREYRRTRERRRYARRKARQHEATHAD